MGQATISQIDLFAENTELRETVAELQAENERLRRESHALRVALDAHITRARSAAAFGPLELSAGTSVGPRRRCE